MAGVARWSQLPPVRLKSTTKIGMGLTSPMQPHRLIPSHRFAWCGPAHSNRPLPRAESPAGLVGLGLSGTFPGVSRPSSVLTVRDFLLCRVGAP